jgi:hypothetical protein
VKATEVHQSLHESLSQFRSVISGVWDYYHIIIPQSFMSKSGDMIADSRLIMGTRTPFQKAAYSIKSIPDSNELYLLSEPTGSLIKILPFVSVMPSPKTEADACYFFNRMDSKSGDARFISYHYEGDSEQMVSPAELKQLIEDFGD